MECSNGMIDGMINEMFDRVFDGMFDGVFDEVFDGKGAEIFNGRSGIWHLHYAQLAHYHMPQNTYCDPLGCVGVRQCKKPRQSNLFRLR